MWGSPTSGRTSVEAPPHGNPLADLHCWRFDYAMSHPIMQYHRSLMSDPGTNLVSHHHGPIDNSRKSESHIKELHVHSKADDAAGIASDINEQLAMGHRAAAANYGLG